jgi:hypothetical protein
VGLILYRFTGDFVRILCRFGPDLYRSPLAGRRAVLYSCGELLTLLPRLEDKELAVLIYEASLQQPGGMQQDTGA